AAGPLERWRTRFRRIEAIHHGRQDCCAEAEQHRTNQPENTSTQQKARGGSPHRSLPYPAIPICATLAVADRLHWPLIRASCTAMSMCLCHPRRAARQSRPADAQQVYNPAHNNAERQFRMAIEALSIRDAHLIDPCAAVL